MPKLFNDRTIACELTINEPLKNQENIQVI